MKLKYFFYLQRSDRRALSILFIGIYVVAAIFLVGKKHLLSHPNSNISNTTAKQTTDKSSPNGTPNTYYNEQEGIAIHLQKFDPNTADSTLLLSLGSIAIELRAEYIAKPVILPSSMVSP